MSEENKNLSEEETAAAEAAEAEEKQAEEKKATAEAEASPLSKDLVNEINAATDEVADKREQENKEAAEAEAAANEDPNAKKKLEKKPEEETAEAKAEREKAEAEESDEEKAKREKAELDEKGKKKDLPAEEEKAAEEEEKKKKKKDDPDADDKKSSIIPDDLLEKAVKVGITIAVAKTFPDAKALDAVVAILTAKKKGGDDADADEAGTEIDKLLEAIPDLDPETYDEGIVAAIKALKGFVGSQQSTIKDLMSEGASRAGEWFTGQVAALGEDFTAALKDQPEKLASLKSKFDVLSAGYKANGGDVDQSVAFKEAIAVVLGDVVAKAEKEVTDKKLAKRKTQHTAKPDAASSAPKTKDVYEDTAEEIDKKYSKK